MEDASSLDSLDELDPEGVFANHLSDAALTHNALITNPDANAAMTTLPLSTASYAEIAGRIGSPKAVRAVAQACAANPVAVAIPCHRVVRTDGALSGYRWGVERKRALLAREVPA